jgi:hypothetical protein
MSYLTDRKQRVIINYSMTTYSYITCGVPQGSVLGPLLFLLYLTGLRDIIEPFSIEYTIPVMLIESVHIFAISFFRKEIEK